MEETNFIRNIKSDATRKKLWQKKPSLFKIFSSQEYKILWAILKVKLFLIALVTAFSFGLAVLETTRTVVLIGTINGLVASQEKLNELFKFKILNWNLDLSHIFSFSDRVGILGFMFCMFVLLSICIGLVYLFNNWFSRRIQLSLMKEVRSLCLKKIFSFNLEYFSQAKSGELMFLINTESSRFSNLVTMISNLITYASQMSIYICLLFLFHWDLTLIVFGTIGLFFVTHTLLDARIKVRSSESNLNQNMLSHIFHQIIYGIKMIKVGGLEKRELKNYFKDHKKFESNEIKMIILKGLSKLGQETILSLVLVLIALYIWLFKDYQAYLSKPESLIGYLFLLIRTVPSLNQVQSARTGLIEAYGPLSRVMNLLQTSDGPDKVDYSSEIKTLGSNAPFEVNQLASKAIGFSYNTKEETLIDVNLDFKTGTQTALVGFSGSGKSTFLDILARVRLPSTGTLSINEQPVESKDDLKYKATVGYMNQEPIIFHDTILNNVRFFKPDASEEEVWAALKLAAADEFIQALPEKLNTQLGERGLSVSGGERQRIGIARILLQNSNILLLDEATNALDYKTETAVYNNIESLKNDKVIIIAAHRLSAIRDFDQIVVFNKGKVVEVGTHQELYDLGQYYYNLCKTQEIENT